MLCFKKFLNIGKTRCYNWCGQTMVSQLNIPVNLHTHLKAKVSDFIVNGQWNIPFSVLLTFPQVNYLAEKVTIPFEETADKLIWNSSNNGELSFKQAFEYKYGIGQNMRWAKSLWCPDIPPSKSLLVWRIMHSKVPTDENLLSRGVQLPSKCSSCNASSESAFHLFFECAFALKLWNWLFSIINI